MNFDIFKQRKGVRPRRNDFLAHRSSYHVFVEHCLNIETPRLVKFVGLLKWELKVLLEEMYGIYSFLLLYI